MQISQTAFDMIVAEEVTSKAYYERHYQRPEWPGVQSGVTVGIGYDLGQASQAKIRADWAGLVPPDMLEVMAGCAGFVGSAGQAKCAAVKNRILVPWDAAMHVFANRDVPAWTSTVMRAVPGSDKLTPSCLGTLVDTAYNRGASFNNAGDRYREMRAIRDEVRVGNLGAVPAEFQSMKRLWPGVSGLQRRCDHRIDLWRKGMAETPGSVTLAPSPKAPESPPTGVPTNAGPARTKPSATSTAQNTTTGVIVAGGTATAKAAANAGHSTTSVITILILTALIAGSLWWAWYRNRNPK
jgi:hypothetical protein